MISLFVPVGYALTLTAPATSGGTYYQINTPGTDPSNYAAIAAGASTTIGPFNTNTNWAFTGTNGDLTYSLDFSGAITSADDAAIALLAPKASPTFTGTPILPTPFKIGAVSMTATGTELNYVAGVTSSVQTQLNAKQATISGASFTAVTVATDDKVVIQDLSDASNIKTVTAQSLANLADLSSRALVGSTVIAPVDTGGAEYTAVPNTVTAVNAIITALIAAGILHIS